MSVKIDSKIDSRKLDSHSHSHSQGSSKKRKISSTETTTHKLTILESSLGTHSATAESDIKSRQTGQRAREKEPFEETATIELKERLLEELETTKSVRGFYHFFNFLKNFFIFRKALFLLHNKHRPNLKR